MIIIPDFSKEELNSVVEVVYTGSNNVEELEKLRMLELSFLLKIHIDADEECQSGAGKKEHVKDLSENVRSNSPEVF